MNNKTKDIDFRGILGKALSVLLVISTVVLTITFSIGLPIYFRPFYYAHIEALDMPYVTDLTKEEIKEAYDEVLDFCTQRGGEFSAGVLKFSEEGASHFADCKKLFNLNLFALLVSATLIGVIIILKRTKIITLARPRGYNLGFWAGIGTLVSFATVGGLAALDFDEAFRIFHTLFFPGKDNWLFDPDLDEVIRIMPEEFFMNCAILILASIVVISLSFITVGILEKNTRKNKNAGK